MNHLIAWFIIHLLISESFGLQVTSMPGQKFDYEEDLFLDNWKIFGLFFFVMAQFFSLTIFPSFLVWFFA